MISLEVLTYIFIFYIGSLFTSFFYLLALRLPQKKTIHGKSECDYCQKPLRLIDVFPLFGYLINKGKCHFCHHPIPIRYLIMELLGGCFFLLSYLIYGLSFNFAIMLISYAVLFISSVIDAHHRIVIDKIWMIGLAMLIIIRLIQNTVLTYLISSIILFAILFIIAFLGSKAFKKDALGGGDIKLYLFIGFILPLDQGLLSILISSLIGFIYGITVLRKKQTELPFVPFITMGVMISFLYGEQIISWYLSLMGVS